MTFDDTTLFVLVMKKQVVCYCRNMIFTVLIEDLEWDTLGYVKTFCGFL